MITLHVLNRVHFNVKFTLVMEKDGQLPFLDLLLRNMQKKLELEIYRNRRARVNLSPVLQTTLMNVMLTLPISSESVTKTLKLTFDVAGLNGYTDRTFNSLTRKRKRTL